MQDIFILEKNFHQLLEGRTNEFLLSKNGLSLTYCDLKVLFERIGGQIRALEIDKNEVVAIVSSNGPKAVTSFLSIAASATAAPLNPSYKEPEFKFYLEDLKAKILLVDSDSHFEARAAAKDLGIKILEIFEREKPGDISLFENNKEVPQIKFTPNISTNFALILHTSGTTSRPKIVPLTVSNILNSANNISKTLRLSNVDRYLNIMPLFHIHGLIAGVLSTFYSGGSIICSNGFDIFSFFKLIKEFNPTWYSGVPTMHQTILSRAERNEEIINQSNIRFIRSSSASLPIQVLHDLESTFSCPVIEAYGMTEASHQMTSNPLPPGKAIPGSVGIAAGPEVAVLTQEKKVLNRNATGEVLIKGTNVFSGYLNNPEANSESFVEGWFKTGDEGKLDTRGFLTITGRLKEIINRGGEKIMPKEIDEIVLLHPSVEQAVTFSVPHEILGEEVGLAVVLKKDEFADTKILKAFCEKRLAKFKVPSKIFFLDEIPKGSTGKLQRIGLAKKLGI